MKKIEQILASITKMNSDEMDSESKNKMFEQYQKEKRDLEYKIAGIKEKMPKIERLRELTIKFKTFLEGYQMDAKV